MQTTYEIDVITAPTAAGRHETTCLCSCGWRLTTEAATSQMATRIAERAQANHFADSHPEQPDHVSRVAKAPAPGHAAALGSVTREGFAWRRSIVCACDWEATVIGQTPQECAEHARTRHRLHVNAEMAGAPGRDYLAVMGLLAIVATLLVVLVWIALDATNG